MVEQRSDWVRRMQKCLDQMNVCVHHAVSNITGTTGMAMIRAILAGERDPRALAGLRDRRCRKSEDQIAQELTGNWRPEHLLNLPQAVKMYDQVRAITEEYDAEIEMKNPIRTTPQKNRGRQGFRLLHPGGDQEGSSQARTSPEGTSWYPPGSGDPP
jgi:hypothetical protein